MSKSHWRDTWPPFRVNLVHETARCLADLQSAATGRQQLLWESLSDEQQNGRVEFIALVYFAQELAMKNLDERGLIP